jgi:hypothetical protein
VDFLPTDEKYASVGYSRIPSVPKQIWIFWDRGFAHKSAEKEAIIALKSWQLINPGWIIRDINMTQAEELTDRRSLINNTVWKGIGMAGRADIYRILLLHKYGGVWTDASCLCSVPLDTWLSPYQRDLYTFTRFDNLKQQQNSGINPWITAWFLVSPPKSYTLTKIVEIISDPQNSKLFTSEYFWFHRIVSNLVATDDRVRRNAYRFPSADAAHSRTYGWWQTAPVFKRHAMDVFKQHLIPNALKCCHNGVNIYQDTPENKTLEVCKTWDCSTLGPNYELPPHLEKYNTILRNINRHQESFVIITEQNNVSKL